MCIRDGARMNPLAPSAIFLDKFCWNFQGTLIMVKMEFHFFVLFLKGIWTKIFTFKDFWDFFNSEHFLLFKVDQIF
jgi:hypothetical protein